MPTQSEQDIKRFNSWAATYDRSFMQRLYFGPIQSRMLAICDTPLGPPRRVLDVGCGTGRFLRAAALRWPQAALTGVDPAPRMIAEAGRLDQRPDFMIGMAESLPVEDQSIDLAASSMSFHHWANQPKALAEIVRVLAPGGRFCLADHTAVFANLLGKKARSGKQIRRMFEEAGLSVVLQKKMWSRFVMITVGRKSDTTAIEMPFAPRGTNGIVQEAR
ncbi:MAG TPA: class I SAM-dependent methyltransferase [Chitinivibrionales bacterium]|nr:class I SAM-dependent methyltransferase [Chitinivibrionales bacterium]